MISFTWKVCQTHTFPDPFLGNSELVGLEEDLEICILTSFAGDSYQSASLENSATWDVLRLKRRMCLEAERCHLVGLWVVGWESVRDVLESKQELAHERPQAPPKGPRLYLKAVEGSERF